MFGRFSITGIHSGVLVCFLFLLHVTELITILLRTSHRIVGGRHPIVEGGLRSKGRQFYQNDCRVGEQERLWVITG